VRSLRVLAGAFGSARHPRPRRIHLRGPVRVLVLLGAPGAGKGTQAPILAERLGLLHLATGDMFRAAVKEGTPVGLEAKSFMDRGELVPDDVTIRMLLERLRQPDAVTGVILDGFPRTAAQAIALDEALAREGARVDSAPYIEVPESELFARLSGRWICRASGHPYHATLNPPRVAGVCDEDGSELYQRPDDMSDVVRARLAKQLPPFHEVVDHYRRSGVLAPVDGTRSIEGVTDALLDHLLARNEGR
jgi:adenylate kinase